MTDESKVPPDDFADLPEHLRPVALQYGRDMVALVMNAGMSQEALRVLAEQGQKHQSRAALRAVGVVSQSFNQLANTLIKLKGWEEGELAQCDRDLMRAFAGTVAVPGESPLILLNPQ